METGATVAIKILDKVKIQEHQMSNHIKKEVGRYDHCLYHLSSPLSSKYVLAFQISVMKKLKHKSILALNEVLASEKKIFIVIEYVPGGELFDCIGTARIPAEQ